MTPKCGVPGTDMTQVPRVSETGTSHTEIYINLGELASQVYLLTDIAYIKLTLRDGQPVSLKTYHPSSIISYPSDNFRDSKLKEMVRVEHVAEQK